MAVMKSIESAAGWLNTLLLTGAGIAGIVVLLRLLKKEEFEVWKIRLSLSSSWLVFSIFTVGHLYLSVLFVRDLQQVFCGSDQTQAASVWQTVLPQFLIFHDMQVRLGGISGPFGLQFYRMSADDPTTWLVGAVVLAVFLAIIDAGSRRRLIATSMAAVVIVTANWAIGSRWAIAASELNADRTQATILRCHKP